MDNKQINKELHKVAMAVNKVLHQSNAIADNLTPANTLRIIYDTIKQTTLNKVVQDTDNTDIQNNKKEEERFELAKQLSDDPDYARAWLLQELAAQVNNNNATAAKELRDILGIKQAESDLKIEITDYQNAIIDCPHCGENVHREPDL